MDVRYLMPIFVVVLWIAPIQRVTFAEQPKNGATASATEAPPDSTATPHVERAVDRIRQQVDWFGPNPSDYSREFLYAVAALNYVQSRVSPLRYALLVQDRAKLPVSPEECLSDGAGICGGQVATFREILDRLAVRNRPVEFYLRGASPAENHGHIGVEVFYNKQWRFFDITWGAFFRRAGARVDDVLSINDVLKTTDATSLAVANSSDLWYQQWIAAGLDPFEYTTAAEQDVIVGGGGVIHLRPASTAAKPLVYTPTHQPNYVGRNSSSPDSGSLSFRLRRVGKQATTCIIAIVGVAGSGQLVVQGKSGQTQTPLAELKPGDFRVDLSGLTLDDELLITVRPDKPQGVGYVVIRQITIKTAGDELP